MGSCIIICFSFSLCCLLSCLFSCNRDILAHTGIIIVHVALLLRQTKYYLSSSQESNRERQREKKEEIGRKTCHLDVS